MGWSTGSILMSDIIDSLKDKVPDDKVRQDIYEALIPAFQNFDCDTLDECADDDVVFKNALKEFGYFEEEDEYIDDDYEEERHYEDE